jgi:hypothetical protein
MVNNLDDEIRFLENEQKLIRLRQLAKDNHKKNRFELSTTFYTTCKKVK